MDGSPPVTPPRPAPPRPATARERAPRDAANGAGTTPEGRAARDGTPGAVAAGPAVQAARPGALVVAAVAAVMVVGVVLRFWTRSDLWLDEALTVNIAKQPLHELPSYLRRDGAPPLFYVLLHVWMGMFGSSDVAVRSLSGVIGVVTVPCAWLAGRRIGGRVAAWVAAVLVATSPFAVYYATEARMYALVALLTVLGFLALARALDRPRPGNLIAVAVVTAALLYSHYWSLYLVGVTGLWLLYRAWRGRQERRRTALAGAGAMVVGGLAFLPWVPIFVYQSRHTGTPWAKPANFAAMVNAITSFAGGPTSQGRALALLYFGLAGLGLFGLAVDDRHIDLDIRTRPRGRPLGIVVVGTLAAAIVGGFLSRSAFQARYASVVFIPLVLLVALGATTLADRRVRTGLVVVAVLAGLAGAVPNVTTNRTQAGQVAAALARTGQQGDVVAYCPDQLGPAVARLLPQGRYLQTTFPRGTGPTFVNWVDYAKASAAGSPIAFAQGLERSAGSNHRIFVVWAGGYQTFGLKCEGILQELGADPALHETGLVTLNAPKYFQPMNLVEFAPVRP